MYRLELNEGGKNGLFNYLPEGGFPDLFQAMEWVERQTQKTFVWNIAEDGVFSNEIAYCGNPVVRISLI